MIRPLQQSWMSRWCGPRARRRWNRPSFCYCSLTVEELEYRTLPSSLTVVAVDNLPTAGQQSPGGTGASFATPMAVPANDTTSAPNATPGSTNPVVQPLVVAESGQTFSAVTSFALGSSGTPATPPFATGNTALAISSNVNVIDTSKLAGDTSITNLGNGVLDYSKGGSNLTGDTSGPRNLDQYWSSVGQRLVTGSFLDLPI